LAKLRSTAERAVVRLLLVVKTGLQESCLVPLITGCALAIDIARADVEEVDRLQRVWCYCIVLADHLLDFHPMNADEVEAVAASFSLKPMADSRECVEIDLLAEHI
jgi:hypothetical protein